MNGRRNFLFFVLFVAFTFITTADPVTLVNRSGTTLELVQGAGSGIDQWSGDLIADRVILDGESAVVDVPGRAPFAFRMLDNLGARYLLYGIQPGPSGKVVVGPEHLARLASFAGPRREVTFVNRTGVTVTALRVSPTQADTWGRDLLEGRFLREGDTIELTVEAVQGSMSFDMTFETRNASETRVYEKRELLLVDGTRLVLTLTE